MASRTRNLDLGGLVHLYRLSSGYFITTVLNQALPFMILPVLTRYLAPSEYGSLALFGLCLAISNSLSGISMPTVISKHFFTRDKKFVAEIIGNSIVLAGLLSLGIMFLILLSYHWIRTFVNLPLPWLAGIPFASFAYIIFMMGLEVLRNSKKVQTFGLHQVGNTLVNLFLSLILIVIFMRGWHGRALGIVISYLVSALIALIFLVKSGFVSFAISGKMIRDIGRVVLPLIPNSFQTVIIVQVGVLFIQYNFSRELLGLYSIGFQLAVMIQLLATTLCMSWTPYLYEQISVGDPPNKLYLSRMFYALFGVLLAGVVFINIASGLILRVMTTPEYFAANRFIPWFSLGFFFQGLYGLLFPILIRKDRQKYISAVSFAGMLAVILLNFLFIRWFGSIGSAYAFCLVHLFMLIAYFWKAHRVLPLPWLRALKVYGAV